MANINYTGTYLLDSVHNAVMLATGRTELLKSNDVSLKDVLGEDTEIKIYLETPIQNITPPYITIRQLNLERKRDTYNHYWNKVLFDIEYIPDDTETSKNRELLQVSEILHLYLVKIQTPNNIMLHSRSLKSEIIDGVLHIFADYEQLTEVAPPDDPEMVTLDNNIYVKKD